MIFERVGKILIIQSCQADKNPNIKKRINTPEKLKTKINMAKRGREGGEGGKWEKEENGR